MVKIKNKLGEVIFTYRGAELTGAELTGAELTGVYLRDANLRDANLRDVNLRDANLRDANLRDANLIGVDLTGADLRDVDLIGANLTGANLRDVDLTGADLRDADLRDADTEFGKLQAIMQVTNVGNPHDTIVVYRVDKGVCVKCGWYGGMLAEFEAKVKETHKGNDHEKTYLAVVELVKVRFTRSYKKIEK